MEVNLPDLPGDLTLNSFLRDYLQLKATKFMCLEGGCGSCICVLSGKNSATGELKTWATNSVSFKNFAKYQHIKK